MKVPLGYKKDRDFVQEKIYFGFIPHQIGLMCDSRSIFVSTYFYIK
jgi:hypothetical protein